MRPSSDQKMTLVIEKPKPEEADELTRIMFDSKRHWGYPEEWFKLWEDMTITPEKIRTWDFYVGRIQNEIVFFYSIKPLSTLGHFELEDCFVAPQHIGKGYGKILFDDVIVKLKDKTKNTHDRASLRIMSDPNAEGFYLQMGAIKIGEEPTKIPDRMFPILEYKIID